MYNVAVMEVMQMNKVQLTIYVPRHLADKKYSERLVKLAKKRERSVSYLLLSAMDRYLNAEEEIR